MKDYRLSNHKPKHHAGDFRVGLPIAIGQLSLISKHTSHIREVRRTIKGGALASGTKMIEGSLVTKLRCSGKNIMVKTFRDGTKNVWEEVN